MKIKLTILVPVILLFISCCNIETNKFSSSNEDTLDIYNKILSFDKIKTLLTDYKEDTIFIIKNENMPNPLTLGFPKNKKIKFIEKPQGYPKYDSFDYKKLQVSFELLKIKKDSASCVFLVKTVGLLADFKLVKRKNIWVITSYSKNMI